jgi:CelD/BcsL family acetyltransferase involved in cellulose biosynthesis
VRSASSEPQFEIVRDAGRLEALQGEWDALWRRTAARRFTHSHAWRTLGWRTTGAPRGRHLHVLVMRIDGEAVLIWPLAVRRRFWLWRLADALGPEFTDYDPLLVAAGPEATDHVRAAWAWLRANQGPDVVLAPRVRHDTELHDVLANERIVEDTETLPSPYVTWDSYETWAAYWRARSKNTKSRYSRRARHFENLGDVRFYVVEDPDEYRELLAWTIKEKIDWMGRTGLANDFMDRAEFHDFLDQLGPLRTAQGRWIMFALRLDGRIIGTKMGTLDAVRYEGFLAAQDPEFATYSVGSILLVKTLQWLMERGLQYDFRIGEEAYKLDWATGTVAATSHRLAASPWGRVCLALTAGLQAANRAKDRLRHAVPADLRQRLKAWPSPIRLPSRASGSDAGGSAAAMAPATQ